MVAPGWTYIWAPEREVREAIVLARRYDPPLLLVATDEGWTRVQLHRQRLVWKNRRNGGCHTCFKETRRGRQRRQERLFREPSMSIAAWKVIHTEVIGRV